MGTHPIFDSDFDCLTDGMKGISRRTKSIGGRAIFVTPIAIPAVYYFANSCILKQFKNKKEQRIQDIVDSKVHSGDQSKLRVLFWNLCCLDGINPVTKTPHDIWSYLTLGGALCSVPVVFIKLKLIKNRAWRKFNTKQMDQMDQSKQTIYARDIQLLQSKLKIDESKASYKEYLCLFILLGIGYNLTDMYHTERTTRELLWYQWGIRSLDHEQTLVLLHVILSRNIHQFETELRAIAYYVQMKTGEETYWDVPSTYIYYSPVVIMQFLFNEMDMSLGPCPLSDNISSLLFKYSVQDLSPGYRMQPFPYLTDKDAELREFLIAFRKFQNGNDSP